MNRKRSRTTISSWTSTYEDLSWATAKLCRIIQVTWLTSYKMWTLIPMNITPAIAVNHETIMWRTFQNISRFWPRKWIEWVVTGLETFQRLRDWNQSRIYMWLDLKPSRVFLTGLTITLLSTIYSNNLLHISSESVWLDLKHSRVCVTGISPKSDLKHSSVCETGINPKSMWLDLKPSRVFVTGPTTLFYYRVCVVLLPSLSISTISLFAII